MRIEIYTSGLTVREPGRGACAAIIDTVAADGSVSATTSEMEGFLQTTARRMAVMAVALALERLVVAIPAEGTGVTVHADPEFVDAMHYNPVKCYGEGDLVQRVFRATATLNRAGVLVGYAASALVPDPESEEAQVVSVASQYLEANRHFVHDIGFLEPKEVDGGLHVETITLKRCWKPSERRVVVTLTNGTEVTIEPNNKGFTQTGGTPDELRYTADVAWGFNSWLNGGDLFPRKPVIPDGLEF